jgi:hypothetical protein
MFMRALPVCTAAAVFVSAAALAGCGSSSSGYTAFAKSKYTNDCVGAGSTQTACKCTLLYAAAHKVSAAMLTAADNAFESGTNDPQWVLSAAEAC